MHKPRIRTQAAICLAALALAALPAAADPVDPAFTYQGQLAQSGEAYTGTADFRVRPYDRVSGGLLVGPERTITRHAQPPRQGEPAMTSAATAITASLAACLLAPTLQAGPQYSIDWYTIDGGGGTSSGGDYTVSGTIGQHDAAPASAGGDYALTGGFWAGLGAGPCNAADLAEPFGLLDLADISAFVGAFTAMDPLADLDGDGLFDLTDVSMFVGAFVAGCP